MDLKAVVRRSRRKLSQVNFITNTFFTITIIGFRANMARGPDLPRNQQFAGSRHGESETFFSIEPG